MKMIFRADDLGFSEGVNYGIVKAIKDGPITCTGLMVNMPGSVQGYELVKDLPVMLGQHTNISVGRPISDPSLIPSLVQDNGEFCTSKEIRSRKEDTVVIEEAEIEIEAQLERFRSITGKNPDYFECHAVRSENFFTAMKNVAKKYDLYYENAGFDKEWEEEHNITSFQGVMLNEKNTYDVKSLFLDNLDILENSTGLMIFHPGYVDQYLLDHSTYHLIRPFELDFLTSDWLKEKIHEKKIEVVDFHLMKKSF